MPNDPPTSEYHRAREAELQLELAIDELVARMADVMRASMDASAAGKLDRAEALDCEYQVLQAELRALELRDGVSINSEFGKTGSGPDSSAP